MKRFVPPEVHQMKREAGLQKPHHAFVDVLRDDPEEAKKQILRALELEDGHTHRAAVRLATTVPIIKRAMQNLGIYDVPKKIRQKVKSRFRLLD